MNNRKTKGAYKWYLTSYGSGYKVSLKRKVKVIRKRTVTKPLKKKSLFNRIFR